MKSIKDFENKKMENLKIFTGGDISTTYTMSNGDKGNDTGCDDNGNGHLDYGETVEFDNGMTGTYQK